MYACVMYVCLYVCMDVCICVCVYVLCMYVCMYVCMGVIQMCVYAFRLVSPVLQATKAHRESRGVALLCF
jgi:hypothetical protein